MKWGSEKKKAPAARAAAEREMYSGLFPRSQAKTLKSYLGFETDILSPRLTRPINTTSSANKGNGDSNDNVEEVVSATDNAELSRWQLKAAFQSGHIHVYQAVDDHT